MGRAGRSLLLPDLDATRALGCRVAGRLAVGDVVLLQGDLGAGKSELARAVIRTLAGADIPVPSPTFTLVQGYDLPRLEVSHGDLYRLGDLGEIQELGLEEAWQRGALLVEWPERAPWLWPAERLTIHLETAPEDGPAARRARLEGTGRWEGALPCLADDGRSRWTGSRAGPSGASMRPILSISGVTKTYASGLQALKRVDLEIRKGEIFALLGPNGAGKTTLINIVCGIVTPTEGVVVADGHDIVRDFRQARSKIGLVPQELATDAFETVWATVSFSRGLFGRAPNPAHLEKVLRDLSLWDKRADKIMTLSGGMKRRVMIAKALSHEPTILFLDEPTAGVDVELRRDMWALVRGLRENGVTVILTTHYIEEAEEMADRVGVISKGELILVEEKAELMKKLGKKQLTLSLQEPMAAIPAELGGWRLELKACGSELEYTFDANAERTGVPSLLRRLSDLGIGFKDLHTRQSSLEEIFVSLVSDRA